MASPTQSKTERINIRLSSAVKNILERAASFEGKTISNFILHSALEQAQKTVHNHDVMNLNSQNSKAFFDALSTPVKFNNKLLSAFEEHAKRVISK